MVVSMNTIMTMFLIAIMNIVMCVNMDMFGYYYGYDFDYVWCVLRVYVCVGV